jgi:hypothetical protein
VIELPQPLDDLPCSVGRSVVDHEDLEPAILGEDRVDQTSDVLPLVVRRHDDKRPLSHGASGSGPAPPRA